MSLTANEGKEQETNSKWNVVVATREFMEVISFVAYRLWEGPFHYGGGVEDVLEK